MIKDYNVSYFSDGFLPSEIHGMIEDLKFSITKVSPEVDKLKLVAESLRYKLEVWFVDHESTFLLKPY